MDCKVTLLGGVVITLLLPTLMCAQGPDTLWTQRYGYPGTFEVGRSIQQTNDGGYIVVGETGYDGSGGDSDVWLLKTDTLGDTLWTKIYGSGVDDEGWSVQQTADSGYIIAGYTALGNYDVWLLKTDAVGETLWTKTYGTDSVDGSFSVEQTPDGGYIVVGQTSSFGAGDADVWLLRTDAVGETLWTKTYGGSDFDYGYEVQRTFDNGYIIGGQTYSFGAGSGDIWLIKTDSLGNVQWDTTYGTVGTEDIGAVQQTADSGYFVTGITALGGIDVWLIKTDADGDTLWTLQYGDPSNPDYGNCGRQTSDGGYIVTGAIYYGGDDILLLKTDSLGDTLWVQTHRLSINRSDVGFRVQQTTDCGYVLCGYSELPLTGWNSNLCLIKTEPDLGIAESETYQDILVGLQISPNPFTQTARIRYSILDTRFSIQNPTISIYDATGRLVKSFYPESSIENQESVLVWDGRDDENRLLPNGVYFLKLWAGDRSATEKLLLIR